VRGEGRGARVQATRLLQPLRLERRGVVAPLRRRPLDAEPVGNAVERRHQAVDDGVEGDELSRHD